MGIDTSRAMGALRLSLGRWSTPDDVVSAALALTAVAP
jgi:cysteine desulfurase